MRQSRHCQTQPMEHNPDWHAIQRLCQMEQWQRAYYRAHGNPDAARYIEERKVVALAQLTTTWQASKKEGTTNG